MRLWLFLLWCLLLAQASTGRRRVGEVPNAAPKLTLSSPGASGAAARDPRVLLFAGVDGTLTAHRAESGDFLWRMKTAPLVTSHAQQHQEQNQQQQQQHEGDALRDSMFAASTRQWLRTNGTRPNHNFQQRPSFDDMPHDESSLMPDVAVIPSVWGSSARDGSGSTADIPVYFVESSGDRLLDVNRLPMGMLEMVARSPVSAGKLLLVGSKTSNVLVVDALTGRLRRSFDHGSGSFTVGAGHETCEQGALLLGRTDYIVRAFDTTTGIEQWNISAGEFTVLDDGVDRKGAQTPAPLRAILDASSGKIFIADASSGRLLWRSGLPGLVSDSGMRDDATAGGRIVATLDSFSRRNILTFGDPGVVSLLLEQGQLVQDGSEQRRTLQALRRLLPASVISLLPDRNREQRLSQLSDSTVMIDTLVTSDGAPQLFAMELPRWLQSDGPFLDAARAGLRRPLLAIGSGQEDPIRPDCDGGSCLVGVFNVTNMVNQGEPLQIEHNSHADTSTSLSSSSMIDVLFWIALPALLLVAYVLRRMGWSPVKIDPLVEEVPNSTTMGRKSGGQKGRDKTRKKGDRKIRRENNNNNNNDLPNPVVLESPPLPALAPVAEDTGPVFDETTGVLSIGRVDVHTRNVLGYGSSGNMVFQGVLDGKRRVAVKRMLRTFVSFAEREIDLLQQCDEHPNVVTYFGCELDREFVYLSLTFCPNSLDTYLASLGAMEPSQKLQIIKKVARQLCRGLKHLHDLNIAHRDIKPQNVLIDEFGNAKLSDMGLAKSLSRDRSSFSAEPRPYALGPEPSSGGRVGTVGWIAPELLAAPPSDNERGPVPRTTKRVDIFSLGCVLHWMVCNGVHPFGQPFEREAAIMKNKPKALNDPKGLLKTDAVAHQLISAMVSHEPAQRPKLQTVMTHPFFWDDDTRLSFLRDASDRFEVLPGSSVIVLDLEAKADQVLRLTEHVNIQHGTVPARARDAEGMDIDNNKVVVDREPITGWMRFLHIEFVDELRTQKFRKYKTSSLRDLLRVIRNKASHFRDMRQEVQDLVGAPPSGLLKYFLDRFPLLLAHSYRMIELHAKDDEAFAKYFAFDEQ